MRTEGYKKAFSERLNAMLDYLSFPKKGEGRQLALAKEFNVSQKGARKWLEGESIPVTGRLGEIVKKFERSRVTTDWLLTGDLDNPPWGYPQTKPDYDGLVRECGSLGSLEPFEPNSPLSPGEVALNFFREIELAGGKGCCEVQENHGVKLRFPKMELKKHNILPEHAACVRVMGNSMDPAYPNGCIVGIDTSKTLIKDGFPYALDHDGHLRIKLLYSLPGGGLRLRSINREEWPDENYTEGDAKKIKVLGWVFWKSSFNQWDFKG